VRVSVTDAVAWAQSPLEDDAELVTLAARCLAADGGLPLAADPGFLRRRWAGSGVRHLQARSSDGRLIAAGTVRPSAAGNSAAGVGTAEAGAAGNSVAGDSAAGDSAAGNSVAGVGSARESAVGAGAAGAGAIFVGLVDPAERGRGLGAHLLDWGLREAGGRPGGVTVETESLTVAAETLFATRGLRQVFAEDVLRIDLAFVEPTPPWPAEATLAGWSHETAARFHRVYASAFRERPGFPDWPAEQWIADLVEDDEFRPGWSLLAVLPDLGDAGFVTAAEDWIVQVGVVPSARGRGLGGALVGEALRRMRAAGAAQAWLDVNVDNPAVRLYRRLGFEHRGRRARYQP
jgi:mycothiol synthase